MNGNGGHSSGGAIAALFFAAGALLLFAISFAFFLVLPFFVFLAGIVAMIVSDRKRNGDQPAETETVVETVPEEQRTEVVKTETVRTEVVR